MNPVETLSPPAPPLDSAIALEIDNIEAEIRRFEAGALSPERFRSFRLAHGIYGQRQPGVQMIRVKIPGGAVTGRKLLALAEIAATHSTGVAHLTTRQDVQFHFVSMRAVGAVLRLLAGAGLTTREACGNSVRNVTACPLAGFAADELFDVQPFAHATWSYLSRNAFCQQLSRKFKIAFSGCPEDCASTAIHDIGLLARIDGQPEAPRRGFKIVVGGGLGTTPFLAHTLHEFVPAGEILRVIRAILRVFSSHGNRRNKMRARLKFVVHRLGIERFRDEVCVALAALTPEERVEATLPPFAVEPGPVVRAPGGPDRVALPGTPRFEQQLPADPAFRSWTNGSVRDHRDPHRAIVTVFCPLGDLTADQLRSLAALVTAYAGDEARITVNQNLALPNVKRSDLETVYRHLDRAGLSHPGAGSALDVTSCPGADTCALGITSSKGLTRELRGELERLATEVGLEALRGVRIKVSGCPNSCGQHHIADIGLHGVVRKKDGAPLPAYQIHWGGRVDPDGPRIGTALDRIVARNAPQAVASLLRFYLRGRRDGEPFADFAGRTDSAAVSAILAPFVEPIPGDAANVDWGQSGPFTTEDLGPGECAGAGIDAVVDPFDNVLGELEQARLFMERQQWVDALANLNRCQYTLARVLLEAIGKKPDSDYEVTCEIRAQLIDRGLLGDGWNGLHAAVADALRSRKPVPTAVTALHAQYPELLDEARRTFASVAGRPKPGEME